MFLLSVYSSVKCLYGIYRSLAGLATLAAAHSSNKETCCSLHNNRAAQLAVNYSNTLIPQNQRDHRGEQISTFCYFFLLLLFLDKEGAVMLSWLTDAHRIRRAVRKRCKQLHPYLSSVCQSPSNRSRNRYRGGNGSTSFSSSTMVLLYRAQRERYHRKPHLHTKEVDPPKPTPFLLLLLFKKEIKNQHIDTPHGIVFDLSPRQY